MQRWLAGLLAVFNVSNGLVMLFASSIWWAHVPGASDTGPFNSHFPRHPHSILPGPTQYLKRLDQFRNEIIAGR